MGDSAVVFTATGWLVINAVLLSLAGFGNTIFTLPANPYTTESGNVTATSESGTVDTVFCAAGVIAGALVGGTGGALLGFGVGGIAGAAIGGAAAGSLLGCNAVQDTVVFLFGLVDVVLNFFGFLFELLAFQIPEIPIFLNALIVLPPGIALGFVALKTIRGAGG